jgi:hypothetical protein
MFAAVSGYPSGATTSPGCAFAAMTSLIALTQVRSGVRLIPSHHDAASKAEKENARENKASGDS